MISRCIGCHKADPFIFGNAVIGQFNFIAVIIDAQYISFFRVKHKHVGHHPVSASDIDNVCLTRNIDC